MKKKKMTVSSWIMLVLILLGMTAYVIFFINGSPEGAEEIDEATGVLPQPAE
jgi:flagellar basal body-associated protein FliL